MTLDNMRSLGVRGVDAACSCGRERTVNVDSLPGAIAVPDVRLRLRCEACGARPAETRPAWRAYRGAGMGRQQ